MNFQVSITIKTEAWNWTLFDGCFPYDDVIGQLPHICKSGSNNFQSSDTIHCQLELQVQTTKEVLSEIFYRDIARHHIS